MANDKENQQAQQKSDTEKFQAHRDAVAANILRMLDANVAKLRAVRDYVHSDIPENLRINVLDFAVTEVLQKGIEQRFDYVVAQQTLKVKRLAEKLAAQQNLPLADVYKAFSEKYGVTIE